MADTTAAAPLQGQEPVDDERSDDMYYGIMVASDFSEHSDRAQKRAALLCSQLKCRALELIAIKEPGLMRNIARVFNGAQSPAGQAMQQLETVSEEFEERYGVRCTHVVRVGGAAAEISARADEISADLTVVGGHPGNSFLDLFRVNHVNKLVRMSKRPVLVVRNEAEYAYRHVLVAVDFSEDAMRAARLALQVAPGAHITFLHAYRVAYEGQMREAGIVQNVIDDFRERAAAKAHQELEKFVADVGLKSKLVSCIVKPGFPHSVICNYAARKKPDLIVIGKQGRSVMSELLMGSVTPAVLDRTWCDVLVAAGPGSIAEWSERPAA
jgi:nucleotide-binding universal stress UspA family protein